MTTATASRPRTPRPKKTYDVDELFDMEDEGKAFELNEFGELEERDMGALSSATGMNAGAAFIPHAGAHDGVVLGADVGLHLWPELPKRLRRPDVAYISRSRLPGRRVPSGPLTVAPELIVEVVSPRDIAQQLEQKVGEYFDAGVRLVWIIYPEARRAFVRRPDGTVTAVEGDGVLSGEDVLPGFSAALADLIP